MQGGDRPADFMEGLTGRRSVRKYSDAVCNGANPAFTCAVEAFGADHLVTGSGYPVLEGWEEYKETFAYIERTGLPKEDADSTLHHNGRELFGFTN